MSKKLQNKPKNNKNENKILFVDSGYYNFYRFNSLKTWYKCSHSDEYEDIKRFPEYKWIDNHEFVDKYKNIYLKLLDPIIKDYKIMNENIIIGVDCPRHSCWRKEYFKEYKECRSGDNDIGDFIRLANNEILPSLESSIKVKNLQIEKAEADDIIMVLTKYLHNYDKKLEFVILTSDEDYLQLYNYIDNNNLTIIDMKGKVLKDKVKNVNIGNFEVTKILSGDKSDNIDSLLTQKNKKKFKKNDDFIDKFINNSNFRKKILVKNIQLFMKYYINTKLVSCNHIDMNIKEQIISSFNSKYKNFPLFPGNIFIYCIFKIIYCFK